MPMSDGFCPPLQDLPSPLFILGPAYSGKSELAIGALSRSPSASTTVIGTAGLSDMEGRIAELKALRPHHWEHRETSELHESLSLAKTDQILIDSMNQWLANFILESWNRYDLTQQDARIELEVRNFLETLDRSSQQRIVIVSSETGAGVTPPQEVSRFFRQALGRTHIAIARHAASVVQVVAGIPLLIKRT